MSDDGEQPGTTELPQIWQFVHPHYNDADTSDGDEENGSSDDEAAAPTGRTTALDYVKLSRRAPRLGQLVRFLNDVEDEEELQQLVLERDPVTQQSLLQWASLNGHFMLVEYLVKRLRRGAFSFDPDWEEVVVFNRWEEMRPELPAAADVVERQKQREQEKAERMAARAAAGADSEEEDEPLDDDEEEPEPMPEELVYDSLDEFHDQWGDRGVGMVKRIGELGVYHGARLRDGTKEGLGQSLFPNGDCYTGQYRNNQREGTGVYWWAATGATYTGDWVGNLRHGKGRMVYPDGSRYLGGWRGDKKHGEGTYTYADGSRYTGAWVGNEKHGQGRYEFTDGASYLGSFHHNVFVSGEWWLASGTVKYVGNFSADKPEGAGVFVHRCGPHAGGGAFQQEGVYRDGKWFPGTLKGTSKVVPRLEVVAPGQAARVPVEFSREAPSAAAATTTATAHYTTSDLVRAANFGPLQAWLARLPAAGVTAKRIEVLSLTYDDDDSSEEATPAAKAKKNRRLMALRMHPHLTNADGTRYRTPAAEAAVGGADLADGIVELREPTDRLLLLLRPQGSAPAAEVALVEQVGVEAAYRLPKVRLEAAGGPATGEFCSHVGTALRLSVGAQTVCPLLATTVPANPLRSSNAESVVLYAQELHPDAFATLSTKLAASSPSPSTSGEAITYTAVPLAELVSRSADDTTRAAATNAQERRTAGTLPLSTVAPQRPPTPKPPAIEPRPELQPLYEAKTAREAAAEEDNDA